MEKNWTDNETIELIKLIEDKDEIWQENSSGANNRNQEQLNNTISDLASIFQCSTSEIRRKINSFKKQVKEVQEPRGPHRHNYLENHVEIIFNNVIHRQSDNYDRFGEYIALELRSLRNAYNRRRLKNIIRKAIIDIALEDNNL